jgi:hypothetical protein
MPFEPNALRLWKTLTRDEREHAARAFWERPPEEVAATAAHEIVKLLKMRPQAFHKVSPESRVRALAGLANPPETVAEALLVALHLEARRPLLVAFLDALAIPHEEGLIAEEVEIETVTATRAREALVALRPAHPAAAIRVYWNALWLQDRERWAGLAEIADEVEA